MTITIEIIESRHSFCIHELISDPEIAKTSDIPHPLPLEEASAWIERMKVLREQGRALTFAVLVNSRVVGVCQLGNRDRTISDSGELGFFTGKAFWGRGYATEGSRLLLMLAFSELGLNAVSSSCLAWNTGAIRVLKKLGFESTHTGSPPQGSKFPQTEQFQYWILTREAWHNIEGDSRGYSGS
jgi:RimJ/RimL family protein N-acetyltransferase